MWEAAPAANDVWQHFRIWLGRGNSEQMVEAGEELSASAVQSHFTPVVRLPYGPQVQKLLRNAVPSKQLVPLGPLQEIDRPWRCPALTFLQLLDDRRVGYATTHFEQVGPLNPL